jgi:hypothetical protein
MQSPPFPPYLVPPRPKYSPQHHILKHPELARLVTFTKHTTGLSITAINCSPKDNSHFQGHKFGIMGIEYELTHVSDFTTKRQPYTQTQILL